MWKKYKGKNELTDKNRNRNIPDILILGVWDFLMGDEGVGVHAIKILEKENLRQRVDLLDGRTGGFHLIGHLESYPYVIMIDATSTENPHVQSGLSN